MKSQFIYIFTVVCLTFVNISHAEEKNEDKLNKTSTYSGLKFRALGPALASGRISDIAVNPHNFDEFYVTAASGGVWKTTNHGTNFKPVFDNEDSYSIGCITIDPKNTNVVWVGTGENNSQRSVSYGDGVYKSIDGGKSWKNTGLENSEHIGKIIIDPRNSDVVWVAAQGPLWNAGGDRGLYKTTDGGESWEISLEISEHTGVTDVVIDPRNPDVMYAASYQRRRHVWTLINGGPESAIYKTTNAGKDWNKLTSGLPAGNVGRIGLAISEVDPDYIFAIIEAAEDRGGFFRSTDRGASWEKRSDHVSASPQYYQEIFTHPKDKDIVISMSTYSQITTDGGKNFETLPLPDRHVDDHALWINPENPDNMLIGGDGGLYESHNAGQTWRFFENLPITQFYRVTVDNDEPFYNIYGGTQDNNTIGGPTQTISANGITNCDWFYTVGGDGFKTQIDPKNPNIVYSQPQYGFLVRHDKQSGQITGVQPQPEKDEILKWNWNSPLIISPHDNKTLYFAANKLFKSTNRGNSWTKISEDLTRQIDRNKLEVMGKVWPPEAVSKNKSTSVYGNIVALDESPVKKGLLYVGTDDGLIHVSENDGESWTEIKSFPEVPETTYVSDVEASLHDENVVYATFDNRKNGDFKPYILKSNDKGKTWVSIIGELPENQPVHTIIQDHENPELLFIGTEFGVYFTLDEGKNWTQLKAGVPTISVKDLDIQRRENDLALGTFGRGYYILDNYTPLREMNQEVIDKEAHIFNVKDALMYIESRQKGRRSMGETFFRADNPPFGATITYYIKDKYETLKDKRKEKEKEAEKIDYPSFEELEKEDREKKPYLIFKFKDMNGEVVRRIKKGWSTGINRVNWDLRYHDTSPVTDKTDTERNSGHPVLPGDYTVEVLKVHNGETTKLAGPEKFTCRLLENVTLPAEDKEALLSFQENAFEVRKAIVGAEKYLENADKEKTLLYNTVLNNPQVDIGLIKDIEYIDDLKFEVNELLHGNATRRKRSAAYVPGLSSRLGTLLYGFWYSTSSPTETHKETLKLIRDEFSEVNQKLVMIDKILVRVRRELSSANSSWVPGQVPELK